MVSLWVLTSSCCVHLRWKIFFAILVNCLNQQFVCYTCAVFQVLMLLVVSIIPHCILLSAQRLCIFCHFDRCSILSFFWFFLFLSPLHQFIVSLHTVCHDFLQLDQSLLVDRSFTANIDLPLVFASRKIISWKLELITARIAQINNKTNAFTESKSQPNKD